MKEEIESGSPATEKQKQAGKFYCKTCKRNHKGDLDGPGYGHWPFSETSNLKIPLKDDNGDFARDVNDRVIFENKVIPSKAAIMYNFLLAQPKKPIFIPLEPTEKMGALETVQLNGLKVAVFKGAYVDVPEQIADVLRNSLNQTARIPFDAKTAPNPFTGEIHSANLSMRSESDKQKLDA